MVWAEYQVSSVPRIWLLVFVAKAEFGCYSARWHPEITVFVGHLFQGRFNSPAIEAEIYLLSCGRYIERNPLEAGLVAEPWTYRWSSCRVDALGEPDPLLTANPWYEELAATGERRQELWRELLLGEDAQEEAVGRAEGVLGSDAFRSDCRRARSRVVPEGRGRRRKQRA